MEKWFFENPPPISHEQAEKAFQSNDPSNIAQALVQIALHDTDWRWVQSKCIQFLDYPNANVRGLVATCFGHVARIHGKLDALIVLPALHRLLQDPEVSGRAEDALDDIAVFLGWNTEEVRKN